MRKLTLSILLSCSLPGLCNTILFDRKNSPGPITVTGTTQSYTDYGIKQGSWIRNFTVAILGEGDYVLEGANILNATCNLPSGYENGWNKLSPSKWHWVGSTRDGGWRTQNGSSIKCEVTYTYTPRDHAKTSVTHYAMITKAVGDFQVADWPVNPWKTNWIFETRIRSPSTTTSTDSRRTEIYIPDRVELKKVKEVVEHDEINGRPYTYHRRTMEGELPIRIREQDHELTWALHLKHASANNLRALQDAELTSDELNDPTFPKQNDRTTVRGTSKGLIIQVHRASGKTRRNWQMVDIPLRNGGHIDEELYIAVDVL